MGQDTAVQTAAQTALDAAFAASTHLDTPSGTHRHYLTTTSVDEEVTARYRLNGQHSGRAEASVYRFLPGDMNPEHVWLHLRCGGFDFTEAMRADDATALGVALIMAARAARGVPSQQEPASTTEAAGA